MKSVLFLILLYALVISLDYISSSLIFEWSLIFLYYTSPFGKEIRRNFII